MNDSAVARVSLEHTRSRCALLQESLELVGRRWNAAILTATADGPRRYSDYPTVIEGISDRLLAQRLRELAAAGLISREVASTTPVQVRYSLTDAGRSLIEAMEPLGSWGAKWLPSPDAAHPDH